MANTVSQKPRFSVAITTPAYQKLISNTLRDPNRAKRFIASITSAVAVNPALQDCEASTIIAGALLGESLNLSPSPQLGQYYLIPFEQKLKDANGKTIWLFDNNGNHIVDSKGKWAAQSVKNATFVLGYKGYIQLAVRSGYYKRINVLEVKEGELISYNPFTEEFVCQWIENPYERAVANTIGYVACFEYLNGFTKLIYWTKDKMMLHADKYSAAFSADEYKKLMNNEISEKDMWKYSSFWYKNFDDMAKKTLLRQLISRWGVMSSELQTALEQDNSLNEVHDGNIVTTPESDRLPEPQPDETIPDLQPKPEPVIQPDCAQASAPKQIDINNV